MSNDDKPDNSPDVVTAACRFCESQADGLDRLCTPCRAESACTGLTDDLTDALENFLDARWSPHKYGYRPAYYLDAPAFGGDPLAYDAEIAAACQQIAAGAKQLIELALGRPVSAEISPTYYPGDDFDGFHASLEFDEPVLHLVKS